MRGPKVSLATQTVLDSRALYVKRLRETVQQYGQIPYMHQKVDTRTADRQAAMMTPEDLMAMAQTNPAQAEATARRAEELRVKAEQNPPPFSAPGNFEVKP